nr:hypothetical protein [Bacteroidales bacterium]
PAPAGSSSSRPLLRPLRALGAPLPAAPPLLFPAQFCPFLFPFRPSAAFLGTDSPFSFPFCPSVDCAGGLRGTPRSSCAGGKALQTQYGLRRRTPGGSTFLLRDGEGPPDAVQPAQEDSRALHGPPARRERASRRSTACAGGLPGTPRSSCATGKGLQTWYGLRRRTPGGSTFLLRDGKGPPDAVRAAQEDSRGLHDPPAGGLTRLLRPLRIPKRYSFLAV